MGSLQLALAALLASLLMAGGSYMKGRADGRATEIANRTAMEEVARVAREASQMAAAEAIAQISVKHTTIRQQAEVITREVPVYVNCRNDDRVIRLLDAARANQYSITPGTGGMP